MTRVRLLTVAAFTLAAVLLFARLGGLPLFSPDEGRNAEVGREVRLSGDWLVPAYNGFPYLDKPVFLFKMVALSFGLLGESEAAARLPSAVSAMIVLALLFVFLRRLFGEACAALAVLVTAASPLFLAFARTVIFDMPLAVPVFLSLISVYLALQAPAGGARKWWALGAAAAGLGTSIKGPVGFLLPLLVALAYGATRRHEGPSRRWRRLAGGLLSPFSLAAFFALTLPWFLGLVHRMPDFLNYGLVEESVRRYSTGAFHRTAPWYYYGPVLLGTFFPFSVLLPEGMVQVWKRRRNLLEPERFLILGALVIVLFFSLSQSKLPGYILVAVILLGALTGRLFARAVQSPTGQAARVLRRGTLVLAFVAAAGALFLLPDVLQPGWLAATFHLHSAEFERLQPAFLPLALTLGALALLALLAWRLARPAFSIGLFCLFSVSLLTVNFPALQAYAESSSSRPVARAAALRLQQAPPGTEVACLQCFPTGLGFYLKRPVLLISRDGHEVTSNYLLYRLRRQESAPDWLVPYEGRDAWLRARTRPVLLLASRAGREELGRMAAAAGATVEETGPGIWGALLATAGGEGR